MKHSGHAIHEYAIILVLLLTLCLGVLKLFGGNISTLLEKGDVSQSADTQKLYSLIDAQSDFEEPGNRFAANIPRSVTLDVDPESNQIRLVDSNNGGAQNTSSLDGSSVVLKLAENISSLTDYKTADGKALPNDIQDLIRKLSTTGVSMGEFYGQYEASQETLAAFNQQIKTRQANGQFGGEPYYDSVLVTQAVQYTENFMAFSDTYRQLGQRLSANPEYAGLQSQIADYAGGVQALASRNAGQPFFQEFHITQVNPADLSVAFAQNPNTARQFQTLNAMTASLPPARREQAFRDGIAGLSEQMTVGSDITESQPLHLDSPVLSAAR